MKENKIKNFSTPIRVYGKGELAGMYFPRIAEESAVKRLMRWIHKSEELKKELEQYGYKERERTFSSRQVEAIFYHLGEP
jgi:hypothetical protein